MKVLIVGGAYQGKRAYAERTYGVTAEDFRSGRATDRLHLLVRGLMEQKRDAATVLTQEYDAKNDWIVLCDEVGSGVIPVNHFDREWREETGRLCIALAERADIVERVCCGIPVCLKG